MSAATTAPDGSLLGTPKQPRLGGATGKGWMPGRSGNPRGRAPAPIDIAELARRHGPKCIEVVAKLLTDRDKKLRLAAAQTLLDRGYGRPLQPVTTDSESHIHLHLLAARAIAATLPMLGDATPELAEPQVIDSTAMPLE